VSGDGANPVMNNKGETLFAGPTYKDIFLQRLRYGTFDNRDMPNHGFLVVLTEHQIKSGYGNKWLAILKEQGFEFIRAVDNSVYSGKSTFDEEREPEDDDEEDISETSGGSINKNYLFGLFRNVGYSYVDNPFRPPNEWIDLPDVVPELYDLICNVSREMSEEQRQAQLPLFKALPKGKFYTEKELDELKVPVTLAGKRSPHPQELREYRKDNVSTNKAKPAPFASAPATAESVAF